MADLSPDRLAEFESFILELHAAAAAIALPLFRADHGLANKARQGAPFDPVTEADKGAEAAIRVLISARYPDHGVIGEEYGDDRADAEFVWVLDPIDGTRAFVAGLPLWTILIGLRYRGRATIGLIGQPVLGEIFVGSDRGSRLVRGDLVRTLKVRACARLGEAVISTTDPDLFNEAELHAWRRLRARARLARYGYDAYAFAMVALGTMDLALDAGLQPWDIEAIVPIVRGAGGLVTDWAGRDIGILGGQMAVAGDRACLDQALEALSQAAQ
jgi:histidinol phosphatase-like enzyme (inositol monophosphatase family)